MSLIKQFFQLSIKIFISTFHLIAKGFDWWISKIRNSKSRKMAGVWLFGGLCSTLFFCSTCTALLSTEDSDIADTDVTTVAISEDASSEIASSSSLAEDLDVTVPVNSLTSDSNPTATAEPEETPTSTNTAVPPTDTPGPPTDTPTNTAVPPTDTPIPPTSTATNSPTLPTPIPIMATRTPLPVTNTPSFPTAVIQGEAVNIRSGPGTVYSIVITGQSGDNFPATGLNASGDWVQVELSNGEYGWMSRGLVELHNGKSLTVAQNIPPAPAGSSGSSGNSSGDSSGNTSAGNTGSSNGNPFVCTGGCATPPPGSNCQIKGNVNPSSGTRIYHVPGGQYYENTDIKPEEGDAWFCTRAEAEAAGFRASQR